VDIGYSGVMFVPQEPYLISGSLAEQVSVLTQCLLKIGQTNTINGERFAGLNFCGFRVFEENCESFSMNILHEL